MIGRACDSLLAKLIVTGATRAEALQRAARALDEFEVDGHGHRAALPPRRRRDPAFAPELDGEPGPFTVHTRWIETEFDNDIPPCAAAAPRPPKRPLRARQTVVVEVGGKRLEVPCPRPGSGRRAGAAGPAPGRAASAGPGAGSRPPRSGDALTAPMQGTVVKVAVSEGEQVSAGDTIVVLEAMKMEQPVNAHKAGMVTGLTAEAGATLTSGATICEITDEQAPVN